MTQKAHEFNTITGDDWKRSIKAMRTVGAASVAALTKDIKIGALKALQQKQKAPKQETMPFLDQVPTVPKEKKPPGPVKKKGSTKKRKKRSEWSHLSKGQTDFFEPTEPPPIP